MKLTLSLADSAQVIGGGKVYALGLGWSRVHTPTPPMALIMMLDLMPDEANAGPCKLVIELLDADGNPARFASGVPDRPLAALKIDAVVNVQPAEDLIDGESSRVAAAVQLGPMPLAPGFYRFEARIVEGLKAVTSESFRVMSHAV